MKTRSSSYRTLFQWAELGIRLLPHQSSRRHCLLALVGLWQILSSPAAFGLIGVGDPNDPPPCATCPCPPGSGGPGPGGNPNCPQCGVMLPPAAAGLPLWWVSEPYINLRLEDEPLGFDPARGQRVSFHLSYRQRGVTQESSELFGLGNNWSCSFRSYLWDLGGTVRQHKAGAGWTDYQAGVMQYRDGSLLSSVSGGYQIEYADGSKELYTKGFLATFGQTYFLTSKLDSAGNTTTFTYSTDPTIVQLLSVSDPDGKVTSLQYTNTAFPNQITAVVDPFSRTNFLRYDAEGYLTNSIDVLGLPSSFQYDAGTRRGWITNLVTPYGPTSFVHGGVDAELSSWSPGTDVNRFIEVTLPTGNKELFLYRHNCTNFMAATYSPTPVIYVLGSGTLDNLDQNYRNSFHWNPLQYAYLSTVDPNSLTSADYDIARLHHWLKSASADSPSDTLSLRRDPTRERTTPGQIVWYDYDGKSAANRLGTNWVPCLEARLLPDGSTRYTHYQRNSRARVTREISTFSDLDGSVALRTNRFYYGSNGIDLYQQVGPNNEQVVSNYFAAANTLHRPNASYDALGQETLYTYNSYGQVLSIQRPSNLTTTNLYFTSGNGLNRLSTTIDLEISRTNSFTYYANGLVQTHTDERGLTTTSFWDNLQRPTGVSFPDGTTTSNKYSRLDLTAVQDRLGNWEYFGYNELRQRIAETNANSIVNRYGYCDCGATVYITNAWSTAVQQVTTNLLDFQGNITYEFHPDFTRTNWINDLGQLYATGDGRGMRYFSHNNQGLLTNVSSAYGIEQATVFDIEDRPIYITDANGVVITNTFDVLGRLRTRGYPDSGVEKFGYSARGMIAYTNQLGLTNFFGYDPAGRKTAETNANWEVIQYRYDASGNLTNLIDAKDQSTLWLYDAYGRVTNKIDQTGTVVLKYSYDPNGRLTNRWSAAKGDTKYAYDPVGNLTNIDYAVSTDIQLQYDALNRLTAMVDAAGTTAYTYTSGNQILTENGPFANDSLTNTYLNRSRTGLSLQQGSGSTPAWTNKFSYDLAGRLTNVTSPAGTFGYLLGAAGPASPLTRKLLLPNSSFITNTYDSVARLTGTFLKNSGGTVLDSATYGYNTASQRTAFTNAGNFVQYAYDKIDQLKVADSSLNTEDRGYAYDAAWNLAYRTNNGVTASFTNNSLNELTGDSTYGYSYDANGNTGTRYSGSSYLAFSWDDENRLVRIEDVLNSSFRTDLVYDGLGRLRRRLEYTNDIVGAGPGLVATAATWVLAAETRYLYDGNRVIQERDGNDVPLVAYTRGTDLSGSLEGAGGIGGLLARSHGYSAGNWSTHNFYHADGNGNITYLVDSSQGLGASYRYDPFGNLLAKSGPLADANVYRFSSKEVHVNSGLYYYLYRFYSPDSQRWINRDPIEERGGVNLYEFVENDPEDNEDAEGLDIITNTDCTITAYCSKGPGADWPHYKPKKKGGKPGKVGKNTLACANTKPPAWPFGSTVVIYDQNGNVIYSGTIHDTGSGWDKDHHNVDPKKWFDVWLPTKKKCDDFGVKPNCTAVINTP